MKHFFTLLMISWLWWPLATIAVEETNLGPLFTATLKPAEPAAGETVFINLTSRQLNLDQSLITWTLNGVIKQQGLGLKEGSFTLGPVGSVATLRIRVQSRNGIAEKILTFKGQKVDLLWEALTYTPPGYWGKALPSPGSQVKVWAAPQITDAAGRLIPSRQLTFKWYKNNKYLSTDSGAGRDYVVITIDTNSNLTQVGVQVEALNGTRAVGSTTIRIINPKIVVYQADPNNGINYQQAVDANFNLNNLATHLVAEPFYFSLDDLANNQITAAWGNNNTLIKRGLVLPVNELRGQNFNLNIVVANQNRLLQKAAKNVKLKLINNEIFSF